MNCETDTFFELVNQFRSLNLFSLLPLARQDYMAMYAISCLQREHPEGCTVSMMTQEMHVPQPAVSRTLRGLENDGYVRREVCRSDRRNTYVILTESGESAVAEAGKLLEEFHAGIQRRFTQEEAKQLMELLRRLHTAAEEELAELKKGAKQKHGKVV